VTAAGLLPVVGLTVIVILFVVMVVAKRRAQRSRGER
jgi:hypothetical protein